VPRRRGAAGVEKGIVARTETAFIGIGSNLDDPVQQVRMAVGAISRLSGCSVRRCSSLYRTRPWGLENQPAFINAVVKLETRLTALQLLEVLQALETRQGRRRDGLRWGPRRLDLDILLYGQSRIAMEALEIPHRHLHQRAFVLLPLQEIDARLPVPGMGTVSELVSRLDYDPDEIEMLTLVV